VKVDAALRGVRGKIRCIVAKSQCHKFSFRFTLEIQPTRGSVSLQNSYLVSIFVSLLSSET
jgi:hypothetical protein